MAIEIYEQYDHKKIPILGLVPESNSTAPLNPVPGQFWNDTANGLKVWKNGAWKPVAYSDDVNALLAGKADTSHNHDDRYFTETEINGLLTGINLTIAGKSDNGHTHDDRYYTETEVNNLLADKPSQASIASQITTAVNNVIGGAPGALDTLKELADALGQDANFRTTILNAIAGKADLNHTHDDRYYTETEINNFLGSKHDAVGLGLTETNPTTVALSSQAIAYFQTQPTGMAVIYNSVTPVNTWTDPGLQYRPRNPVPVSYSLVSTGETCVLGTKWTYITLGTGARAWTPMFRTAVAIPANELRIDVLVNSDDRPVFL